MNLDYVSRYKLSKYEEFVNEISELPTCSWIDSVILSFLLTEGTFR